LSLYWIEASGLGTCALSEGTVGGVPGTPLESFGSDLPGPIECWGLNNGNVFGNTGWSVSTVPNVALRSLDTTTTELSLFNTSACAMSAGDAYCWGGGGAGETGDGTNVIRVDPTPVVGVSLSRVSAGSGHSCGIAPGGRAYCWGANNRGQLGTGNKLSSLVPVPVAGGLKFKEIYAAGANPFVAFTCGLTSTGEAYCWGANEVGELGDGTIMDRLVPTPVLNPQ
jgi:alpha-tubulin suppressor-like RCC1 family protein